MSAKPRRLQWFAWAMLLVLPGCEPDECDLDFRYLVDEVSYQLRLAGTDGECSYDSFTVGSPIVYTSGGSEFEMEFPNGYAVGTHFIGVTYRDTTGRTWYSRGSGLFEFEFDSACVATIVESELVDWIDDDHRRVRGVVSCALPLYDTQSADALPGARQLQLTSLSFNIYTGILGF